MVNRRKYLHGKRGKGNQKHERREETRKRRGAHGPFEAALVEGKADPDACPSAVRVDGLQAGHGFQVLLGQKLLHKRPKRW